MAPTQEPRVKVYSALSDIAGRFHFAPLDEGPAGRLMHRNLVLMALSCLMDKNHLLVGEPGWGKTTGAKILAARLTGLPYDLYDAMEIRGNPQKYEEKIVGRPHYGRLARGEESVVWQGSFGLDVLNIDEANRLPYDSQDVILQGIDTGRWNYQNQSLFEGKKPAFLTMNERTGNHENGLLPALKDRLDIVTEEAFFSTMVIFDFHAAKEAREKELCRPDFTSSAVSSLGLGYDKFKAALKKRPVEGHLTEDERKAIREQIASLEFDNDAMLFLQAFMAEINYSAQYGTKRASDPASQDTHDQMYAGVSVRHSFSPRSVMAAMDYARGLAWFMGGSPGLDHVRYVLPHVFAHKADFSDDYKNKHGNAQRRDSQMLHLAKTLVSEVFLRYTTAIQPMKNLISVLQRWEAGERGFAVEDDSSKELVRDLEAIEKGELKPEDAPALKADRHDHPLMKDLVANAREMDRKAFYEES
ncbi:MAG: AAA family ATPase [Candidatus Micrarchaeota archaeon]